MDGGTRAGGWGRGEEPGPGPTKTGVIEFKVSRLETLPSSTTPAIGIVLARGSEPIHVTGNFEYIESH
jgi:hypothetical protein